MKPVVDKRYSLSEVGGALRHFGEEHTQGKVVITPEHRNKI
ncbi:hypothetical protein KJ966_19020 [bacterium]|nr:hypothetical protein [bacterium]